MIKTILILPSENNLKRCEEISTLAKTVMESRQIGGSMVELYKIAGAIVDKQKFNADRADHKRENRQGKVGQKVY